jgi:PHP family Zn ribbon phosphoesterase
MYEQMTNDKFQISNEGPISEFQILLDLSQDEIGKLGNLEIAEAVMRVRNGQVRVEGGYDGLFGKINIFNELEREKIFKKPKQISLF